MLDEFMELEMGFSKGKIDFQYSSMVPISLHKLLLFFFRRMFINIYEHWKLNTSTVCSNWCLFKSGLNAIMPSIHQHCSAQHNCWMIRLICVAQNWLHRWKIVDDWHLKKSPIHGVARDTWRAPNTVAWNHLSFYVDIDNDIRYR